MSLLLLLFCVFFLEEANVLYLKHYFLQKVKARNYPAQGQNEISNNICKLSWYTIS